MKLLFIGESWLGSCARSLKEALGRNSDVELDEINEDAVFPAPSARWLRAPGRLLAPFYRRDFNRQVLRRVRAFEPDVVVAYKGSRIGGDLLHQLREEGVFTVNIYPDCSPHAHGDFHKRAVGRYDLVISTKIYHPELWQSTYGYKNACMFIPQGYDPTLHLVRQAPSQFKYDVVMVATYRGEYGDLMKDLSRALGGSGIRVAIGGSGWEVMRRVLPSHWEFMGPVEGRTYVSLLRSGAICIAPLSREICIKGRRQPGDVDTTRTYELAAAHCFFVHRRTAFARKLYGEDEVPMFDDSVELASQIRHFLAEPKSRVNMARAAHVRAVPAYSLDARARSIVMMIMEKLEHRK